MSTFSRACILSVLLTAFMLTGVSGQKLPSEIDISEKPGVGDEFPHFQLTNTEHEDIDLYDYFQNQPVLLIYYRGGW